MVLIGCNFRLLFVFFVKTDVSLIWGNALMYANIALVKVSLCIPLTFHYVACTQGHTREVIINHCNIMVSIVIFLKEQFLLV